MRGQGRGGGEAVPGAAEAGGADLGVTARGDRVSREQLVRPGACHHDHHDHHDHDHHHYHHYHHHHE